MRKWKPRGAFCAGLIRLITKAQTVLPSLTLVDTTFDCGFPAFMSYQQTTRVSGSRTYNTAYPRFQIELSASSESRATRFRSAIRFTRRLADLALTVTIRQASYTICPSSFTPALHSVDMNLRAKVGGGRVVYPTTV